MYLEKFVIFTKRRFEYVYEKRENVINFIFIIRVPLVN